ncbi:MAG: recombinase family protein [Candidatus Doudnabacteria bacterium]|nr:recombinase family protein [Candidatus Doudnabacteria bacterium]
MNILYCRKSSEAQDRQVASIDSQKDNLLELAKRNNLNISKTFTESMSAKQPGRPQFEKMIKLVEAKPGSVILVWKLDRLARNPVDEGKIKWLLQKRIISQIITPERIYLPDDNALISAVEFGMANQYIRDLSTNVKRGNKTKLEKGELPGAAPIGYLDNLATKKKEIDPIKSVFIKQAFELYATGGYSLKDVNNITYQNGFRTKGGLKPSKAQFHHILQNPFYYGAIRRNGQLYQGIHQPIISKVLFDTVQDVLSGKSRSKKQKHFFPARGFMFCHSCGCLLTASTKKGHAYYYCTNGKGNCLEHKKYLRDKAIDGLIANTFQELKFDEHDIEIAYRAAREKTIAQAGNLNGQKDELAKKLKSTQEQLANLIKVISTDPSMTNALKPQILNLEAEAKNIQGQISNHKPQTLDEALATLEQTKKTFLQASVASFEYLESTDDEKFELLKKLLWNLKLKNQIVQQYQFKSPFSLLAESPKNLVLNDWLGC